MSDDITDMIEADRNTHRDLVRASGLGLREETCRAVTFSPSPGTPGEGRGEGLSFLQNNRAARDTMKTLTLTLSRNTGRGNKRFVL